MKRSDANAWNDAVGRVYKHLITTTQLKAQLINYTQLWKPRTL